MHSRLVSAACAAVVVTALAFESTDAHGYLSKPAAQFIDPSTSTYYAKTITADVNSAFAGLKWDDSPEANTATFTSSFANAGYSSLRDMLDQQVSGCANTRTDVSPVDVSGLTALNWQNDKEQKGFIDSHHGPCEVWIDDTMVERQDDCVAKYGTAFPASVNADFSQCSGDCTLRFYWLALHEPLWQIYKQCVPVVNKSGAQTPKQVQGTVSPAGTIAPMGNAAPASTATPASNATQPGTAAPTVTAAPSSNVAPAGAATQPGTVIPAGTASPSSNVTQPGTVSPAGTAAPSSNAKPVGASSTSTSDSEYGCQTRALRTAEDSPTRLANGAKINWTDSRFLRAFDEFATTFQASD